MAIRTFFFNRSIVRWSVMMVVVVVQVLYSGDGGAVFGCTGIVTGGVGGRQWHWFDFGML